MKLPYNEYIKTPEYKANMIRKKLWDFENDCPKGGWKYVDDSPGKGFDSDSHAKAERCAMTVAEIYKIIRKIDQFMLYGPEKNTDLTIFSELRRSLENPDLDHMLNMTPHELWVKSKGNAKNTIK